MGYFTLDFPSWGGTAACLVPKVIQQETCSGRSMGDVALLLLGGDSQLFLVQGLIGLGLTGLHMRNEVKVLLFNCYGRSTAMVRRQLRKSREQV